MTKFNHVLLIATALLAVLCGGSPPAQAAAPMPTIRGPGVSREAFAARLSSRGDLISLADVQLSRFPPEAESRKLATAFARAQTTFLDGDAEEAERAFRDLIRMARDTDWREYQRRTLFFAMIRLAQLAGTSQNTEDRLDAAATFASDLSPDPVIFPPPLVAAWPLAVARMKAKSTSFVLADKFDGYEEVRIDGHAFAVKPGATVSLAPGPHRVSARSNSHPYFSQLMTGSQLDVMRIDQAPVASGDCTNPRAASDSGGTSAQAIVVVYPECILMRDAEGWRPLLAVGATHALRADLGKPLSAESGGTMAPEWARENSPAPAAASSSHKWYWIAASVAVAAGAGIWAYQAQQSGSSPPTVVPAQREGF